MELQISPITLIIILVYVSGLAFSIGRIYEQLRQAKRNAAEQSAHPTVLCTCETIDTEITKLLDDACPVHGSHSG